MVATRTSMNDARMLAGSAGHLAEHIARCEICLDFGTKHCGDANDLRVIVLADRRLVLGGSVIATPGGAEAIGVED
jgi:hypothetical protein